MRKVTILAAKAKGIKLSALGIGISRAVAIPQPCQTKNQPITAKAQIAPKLPPKLRAGAKNIQGRLANPVNPNT
jgi:hypothetical protein